MTERARAAGESTAKQTRATSPGGSALLTDLYQLTMAQAAWKLGRHELRSVFHLTMRRCPFGGDFAIAAGVDAAAEYAEGLRFDPDDLGYLGGLRSRSGAPLFDPQFLDWLGEYRCRCDVHAVAEGETLLAGTPMVRVEGGLLDAQLLETPFLNLVGVQTLVATRAARICHWAAGVAVEGPVQPVLEFGLRRAHGPDGALGVSRAAYVGGCAATSNLLAGRTYGIPVSGTHAHSWVLSFDEEIDAFRGFADVFPDDTTLLVDTYSTERGMKRAAQVGQEMQQSGHELRGVRLDSGDLAALSRAGRRILDEAGLPTAQIAASGDLDEDRIEALRRAGARVDLWGVGARLATSRGDASFSGAYKLALIEDPRNGEMRPVAKISEDRFKRSLPGRLQVRRSLRVESGRLIGDVLYDERFGLGAPPVEESGDGCTLDLLRPVLRSGGHVAGGGSPPEPGTLRPMEAARMRAARCIERLGWRDHSGCTTQGVPPHGVELALDSGLEQEVERLEARKVAATRLSSEV